MAAGKPTILAIGGVIKDVITTCEGGVSVQPGDAKALADAVRSLADNRDLAREMGTRACNHVRQHFDRDHQSQMFIELLQQQCLSRAGLYSVYFKRLLDILGSVVGLIVIGPLAILIAVAVACVMGHSVLFRQRRPGRNGVLFQMYKFRTMRDACDSQGKLLPDEQRMTWLGEVLLLDAFDSNWIAPLGPHVDTFEAEFAEKVGVPHAVALCSGTAALHLAVRLLDVGAGDEVFVSTLTFAASAYAVEYVGADPIFIDSNHETWNMCPELLAEALSDAKRQGKLPKAILVVDVLGQCADYDRIVKLADAYAVPIIEDAAEALGALYLGRPAGSFGKIGCFSFNGNKMITTSGGGMLVTDNPDWAKRARYLASQARQPAAHYEHYRSWVQLSAEQPSRGCRTRPTPIARRTSCPSEA